MPLFNIPAEVLALILHHVKWKDLRMLRLTSTDAKAAVFKVMKSRASTFTAMFQQRFGNNTMVCLTSIRTYRDSSGDFFECVKSIWLLPDARICHNRKAIEAYLTGHSRYTNARVESFKCIDYDCFLCNCRSKFAGNIF